MKITPSYLRNLLLAMALFPIVSGPWLVTNAMADNSLTPAGAYSALMSGATVNTQSAGYYESGTRKEFVAGGISMSVPRQQLQLVSVTPMSFSGGSCAGISAQFGGISFLQSDQLVQAMKTLASNAVSSIFLLSLKTLCPICGSVLEWSQKLAQAAAKMTMDTCRVSQNIAAQMEKAWNANQEGAASSEKKKYACLQTMGPQDSDTYTTLEDTCRDVTKAVDKVNSWINGGGTDAEKQARATAANRGNVTYRAAIAMGYDPARAELMMNLLGTVIAPTDVPATGADGATNPASKAYGVPPTLRPGDALTYFMCGLNVAAITDPTLPGTLKYCSAALPAASTSFTSNYLRCDAGNKCEHPTTVNIGSLAGTGAAFDSVGFLPQVEKTLYQAVADVAASQPLKPEAKALINSATFPLYEAINLSAVYPNASFQIISASAIPLAAMLSQSFFDRLIFDTANAGPGAKELPPEVMHQVMNMLTEIDSRVGHVTAEIQTTQALQQAFLQQIRQIEAKLRSEVLSKGLAGNQAFATGQLSGVAPPPATPKN